MQIHHILLIMWVLLIVYVGQLVQQALQEKVNS